MYFGQSLLEAFVAPAKQVTPSQFIVRRLKLWLLGFSTITSTRRVHAVSPARAEGWPRRGHNTTPLVFAVFLYTRRRQLSRQKGNHRHRRALAPRRGTLWMHDCA